LREIRASGLRREPFNKWVILEGYEVEPSAPKNSGSHDSPFSQRRIESKKSERGTPSEESEGAVVNVICEEEQNHECAREPEANRWSLSHF
jgi:hypothetical protein